jgi:phosphonate metabolism-associated iron-containing alcohol dehydrogenase
LRVADVSRDVWGHFNPVRLMVGRGALARLTELVPENATTLLVTSAGFSRRGVTEGVRRLLGAGRVVVHDRVTPNPELDDLERATADLRSANIEAVVGLGGGSTLDTAKALSVALCSDGARPLEAVFRRDVPQAWSRGLRMIAIPTTAGTGAEVTPFATVWDATTHRKHSLGGDKLYPYAAVLDPELTVSLPADETLYSALDAISHSLESLWNKNRTPVSQLYALRALELAAASLTQVLERPADLARRMDMQQASMFAGLAISQTRTAVAHSVSYPLTSRYGVPHGLACSFTLPAILRMNIDKLSLGAAHVGILRSVLVLLESLELPQRLARYASAADVLALQAEMLAKGRIENFTGMLRGDLAGLLSESLSP